MIPLGDDNSLRKSTPIVTYALIIINILVFFLEMKGGEPFILKWAFTPNRFIENPYSNFSTIFTAMFMHAGLGHLVGNMLYLWIFGDNVEDHFGKLKYLIFYLVSGMAATFAQLMIDPKSSIPNLGASGAIAGVLGAYILLFPKGKVNVMIGYSAVQLSALMVIGFWFLLQFMGGFGAIASTQEGEGGVAYMAHIGGFIAGLAVAFLFRALARKRP
ncbi:rhomboid family intramembrane serine protease [Criblamydia sequanensis]|uniref:Rhomboid family protein n=1 Tax=Candidatus Criblamydia sequanensis CRIB-18 TaxID=1437425 RepID=A0A090D0Y8_9BACT|nr:rhomboid family intramembrane serine protease [Criblamydia sequanensis]CDR35222.1 Rhomboid family protein [Criblamydia sequanensis CRIB-18]